MLRHLVERLAHALWFGKSPGGRVAGLVLAPVGALLGLIAARRRRQIESLPRPRPPVIIVGNLVVGGSGKTPLALALARALSERGLRVGLLCGGYRARRSDARLVPADADAREHGDEACLLASATPCPVAAGRDRGQALTRLTQSYPDLDAVIADDGLQHLHLPRSIEIAVFDRRGAGNGRLLPAGPLREPLRHVSRMDAVALNDTPHSPAPAPRQFQFQVRPVRFVALDGHREPLDADAFAAQVCKGMAPERILAMAGIGEPERFFDSLRALGIRARTLALADHAEIDARLLSSIKAELILMTAKDAVKCRSFADRRCWALEVSAHPDPGMIDWLLEALRGQPTA